MTNSHELNPITFYRASGPYGCFSNLHRRSVVFEGMTFRSAEDAYQFGKARHDDVRRWILAAPTPANAAAAAHCLPPHEVQPDWNDVKVQRMASILIAKFSQDREARELLLATGDAPIVEASHSDSFWGTGKTGQGLNILGRLLMWVRSELEKRATDELQHIIALASVYNASRRTRRTNDSTRATVCANPRGDLGSQVLSFDVHDSRIILSNYYERTVMFEGHSFPTAGQAFEAGKVKTTELVEWLAMCRGRLFPYAKDAAILRWDVRRDWRTSRVGRLKAVLVAKFTQHCDLRKQLLDTAPYPIVAISYRGKPTHSSRKDDNLLGAALMSVRDQLSTGATPNVAIGHAT